jgi:putative transposase
VLSEGTVLQFAAVRVACGPGAPIHLIVLNERQLRRLLRAYLAYHNTARPHQALANDSPHPREVQSPARGRIVVVPQVGGLHHRYQRAA